MNENNIINVNQVSSFLEYSNTRIRKPLEKQATLWQQRQQNDTKTKIDTRNKKEIEHTKEVSD